MRLGIALVILFTVITSCEHENEEIIKEVIVSTTDTLTIRDTTFIRDSIYYPAQPLNRQVYNPPLEWNTIDTFVLRLGPMGSFYIPQPSDSIIEYKFSVDNDTTTDFLFKFKHWVDVVSTSSPSANYFPRKFDIVALPNSNCSFAYERIARKDVTLFDYNEDISTYNNWRTIGQAYHIEQMIPVPLFTFSGVKYLLFKKEINLNTYYGWAKIEYVQDFHFKLHEMVFNPNANMSLRAGQTQL